MQPYPPGTELGGYRLDGKLGTGGMGTVYRAVDADGHEVALKLLHPAASADAASRERLRREVAALHRIRDPQVARVLDAETDSVEAFIVTELIEGCTLSQRVDDHGPLEGVELADMAHGLAEVLERVHAQGVVHRDMKPANIMVGSGKPVLIDFGIAQQDNATRVTSAGMVVGTPGFLAPELLTGGEASTATDWYGFAAVVLFAATGREPFGDGPLEAVIARVLEGRPDTEGLDPGLAAVLSRALARDPAARLTHEQLVVALSRPETWSAFAADAAPRPGRVAGGRAGGAVASAPASDSVDRPRRPPHRPHRASWRARPGQGAADAAAASAAAATSAAGAVAQAGAGAAGATELLGVGATDILPAGAIDAGPANATDVLPAQAMDAGPGSATEVMAGGATEVWPTGGSLAPLEHLPTQALPGATQGDATTILPRSATAPAAGYPTAHLPAAAAPAAGGPQPAAGYQVMSAMPPPPGYPMVGAVPAPAVQAPSSVGWLPPVPGVDTVPPWQPAAHGTLTVSLAAAMVALATLWPAIILLGTLALGLVAATWGRIGRAVGARRQAHGSARRSDRAVAVASIPHQGFLATFGLLPAVAFGTIAGGVPGVLIWRYASLGTTAGGEQLIRPLAVVVAGVLGLAVLWASPWTASLHAGVFALEEALLPGRAARAVAAVLAWLVVAVVVTVWVVAEPSTSTWLFRTITLPLPG